MRRVLSSLPSKSSTGTDGISYRLLKEAGPAVVGPLTTSFNISLRLSQVRDEWKRSVISPLFNGGNRDRQEAKNYRAISLTSCVARVMEKLLNEQILNYLQDQSLICNEQSGFLPGQSTVTQLCFLINRWQVAIDRGEGVEAIFLDFSKGYDRVSIPGLIYKLSRVGFSQAALKWFSSFLTDRQQRERVHGSESSWETVKSGIPQGTVLGPTLFLIYINDLPQSLLNECALFADDTTAYGLGKLYKTICSSLSSDMDSSADWAKLGECCSTRKRASISPSNKVLPLQVRQTPMWLWVEYKYRKLRNINTLALQYKALWSGLAISATCTLHALGELDFATSQEKVTAFNNLKDLHRNCPSNHGICLCHLEWWPNSKAEKAAALILPESRCNLSLPPLQTRFDYFTLMLFYKIRMRLSPQSLQNMLPNPLSHSGYQFCIMSYPVPKVKKSSTLASFSSKSHYSLEWPASQFTFCKHSFEIQVWVEKALETSITWTCAYEEPHSFCSVSFPLFLQERSLW